MPGLYEFHSRIMVQPSTYEFRHFRNINMDTGPGRFNYTLCTLRNYQDVVGLSRTSVIVPVLWRKPSKILHLRNFIYMYFPTNKGLRFLTRTSISILVISTILFNTLKYHSNNQPKPVYKHCEQDGVVVNSLRLDTILIIK